MSAAASMGQALFGLIVVLGVIAVLAWLARRFTPAASAQGALLKKVGAMSLGPRERVVVVEVADTWLVLGVTAQQVNTLHTLAKVVPAAGISEATGSAADKTAARAFATLLARVLKNGANNESR